MSENIQKITCDVDSCKYNDCSCNVCNLSEVKIGCGCLGVSCKDNTICCSFEKEKE